MATNPFDYLNRFKNGGAPAPKPADPISATLDAMREDDLRAIMREAGDPNQTADVTKLARETGLPPALVEDRVDQVKRDLAAGKLVDVLNRDPALAKWAADNPRAAATARNDAKALGFFGSIWDTVKKLPATGKASVLGLGTQGAKMNYAISDFFGEAWDGLSSFASPNTQTVGEVEDRKAQRKAYWNAGVSQAAIAQEKARTAYTGYVQRNLLQGLESVPSSLQATLAGVLTRNPNVALGMMGAQTGLPAYADARIAGKAIPTAIKYGVEQGGVEALTEKIPAGALLDAVTKKTPFGKAFMAQLASEIPGEQVATVLQDLSTWATLNPEKTVSQFLAERPEAALSTLLQTVSGTTAQTGLTVTTSRAVDAVGAHLGRRADQRRAEGERALFDKAGKVAQDSELNKLDPEAFQSAVKAKAEAEGVTHVMIPGEVLATYMQSDSYDQEEGEFKAFTDQIAEAAAVGGDVVLPVEFALGVLPTTPAWGAIKDDLRLTPGGLSPREAEADAGQIEADIETTAADLAKTDKALGERVAMVEQLTQRIADKLMNAGFTPYAARQQAVVIATRQATRAQRMGREVDLTAWDTTEVRNVLPPALAAARKADATDLVINAMRKGGAATVQSGKSLLPWIAARGGIEDRGGDIAAMGGDKWHRGKVGQKKLLKAFEEAQGNMLGGATGDNSIERLFDAAISEGFFPDLYAAREAGEKIDNRAFLDAIGSELRGSPIYAGEAQVDGIRAAAEELTTLLGQRGIDASALSDADLRAEIEGLDEQGDASGGGLRLLHGGRAGLTLENIEIIRQPGATKQGKRGRVYGGFYGTTVESHARGYADMNGGSIYSITLKPDAVIEEKQGDITRLSPELIEEYRARGVDVIVGKDVRGRTEHAIINKDAIASLVDVTGRNTALDDGPVDWLDQIPDTVEIDGVARSTRNSEGQPLAGSEEGVRAFWAWFGDSKVVDEEGRPLVVYHGTRSEFEAFEAGAEGIHFGTAEQAKMRNGQRVIGAYISAPSIKRAKDTSGNWRKAVKEAARTHDAIVYLNRYEGVPYERFEQLRAEGISDARMDSMSDKDFARRVPEASESYIAFSPTQIKSVNNRGTFDPGDARILYQRTGIDLSAGGGSKSISIGDATVEYGVSSNGETAEVILVSVPKAKRRGGAARKAMQEFLAATDAAGLTVFLTAHPMGKGGASKAALEKFYKSLGFVENKGRYKDFRAMQGMVRQPPRILYQSAYHGSPHIFDRFSLDKIGTGEGAQAYGWGLYFAGRKEIAEHYRNTLTLNVGFDYQGQTGLDRAKVQTLVGMKYGGAFLDNVTRPAGVADKVMDDLIYGGDNKYPVGSQRHGMYETLSAEIARPENTGRLYHVEIPDDDEYLLWDKPLSEQPEKVRAALEVLRQSPPTGVSPYDWKKAFFDAEYLGPTQENAAGGVHLYKNISAVLAKANGQRDADEGNGWTVVNPQTHYNDRMASLALHNAGIAGIKYLDGGSRSQGDGSFNYVVFDDSRVSIQAYEQSLNDGPRGRIMFPGDGRSIIELFQARNLSTLIHEVGHQWLEELRADAESADATEQLKADWQAVQDWFAANNMALSDGVIPVEAHEMWARGVERYMMEGKAPTTGLQRVFETFRGWLISIYKVVDALRSPITPEIRGVMDRLIATDEEIARVAAEQALSPLFKDAAAIGMTGAEFDAYTAQVANARGEAHGALLDKTMAAIRRRETAKWREDRKAVMADIAEEVAQRPLYRALAALKDTPLSREWLVSEFGVDAVDLLPRRVPPIYRDGGAHPSDIAELAGYTNGREMIEALIGAELAHRQAKEGGDQRTMRARTVETETDAEMNRRYGDALNDGSIEREALEAVHNEMQGEVMATEIRALARRTGKRATPYQIARRWARDRVRQGVYAIEASPSAIQRHARNAAKAGREAEKAMMAGNAEDAFRFKQQQMLSSALLSEAKAAHDEIEAARKYLDRIASRRTMDGVDQDYFERAHELLEDVDLRQRSQKEIGRKTSFEEWAAAKQAQGVEVVVPDRFAYAGKNWSRLSVDELLGLNDAVKSVIHLGRRKQTMLDNKARREFEEWKAEALVSLEETPNRPVSIDLTKDRSTLRAAMATGLKVENLARELDNDKPGVWTRLLVNRATEAENYRSEQRKRVLEPIAAAYMAMSNKQRDHLAERITVPDLPFRSADLSDPRNGEARVLTRWEIVGIALNLGTASNLDKLARGYGVDEATMEAIAKRELTDEDWRFVQSVWTSLETLWPDIARVEREMSGVEPERVDVREVETPFGTLTGGYYPVVYDPAQSQVGEDNENKAADDMFGRRAGVATAKGHTKARTGFAAPILLAPESVLFQHVEKVITRNAYAPWVRDVLKVIRDRTIRPALDRTLGSEYREMIEPWLRRQINSGLTNERGTRFFNRFLRQARVNMTVVSMGLRWSTGVAQTVGLANSAGRIGANNVRKGLARVLRNPNEAARFVFERSPEMELRTEEMNRDVVEAFRSMRAIRNDDNPVLAKAKRKVATAQAFAFWHIGMIDRYAVSIPTWLGAHEKALGEGMSDEDASAYADSMVRLSQGSGREKDLAAIQSPESEAMRFFTMFYTPFNVLLNAQWETGRAIKRGDWRKASQMTLWFMIVTPLLDALLAGDKPDDDDEYGWVLWLLRNVGFYTAAGVPIARDLGNVAERKLIGEYAVFNPGPIPRVVEATSSTGKDAWDVTFGDGEASDRWLRNAIETPGYFLGLPTGQPAATAQFMWDVSEGNAQPDGVSDWYQGLTKGKIKEE